MLALMTPTAVPLPDDIAALKAMVAARDQMIEALKLTISKLQQVRHGASSERSRKLLDQLELQLAELQESAAQTSAAAAIAAPAEAVSAGDNDTSLKPARRALPESICLASASCILDPLSAPAVAASFASWARISPRRWSMCRRAGR
jgi:hypothetical protein